MTTLSVKSGDDLLLEFTITDEDGVAVDITNMVARAVVATIDRVPVHVLSTDTNPATLAYEITDAAAGLLEISANAGDTEALEGTYQYEVKLEDTQGEIYSVADGKITFSQNLIQ